MDKPKNTPYECVIAVYDNGISLNYTLLKSEPNLLEDGIFDGDDLEDNLTETKNFPKEVGIYKCKIIVECNMYYTDCGNEYDMNACMEDIEKILNF